MEFRLTYAGPLHATQRDPYPGQAPKHTQNRHDIRVTFHHQLKSLWELPPLKESHGPKFLITESPQDFVVPAVTADELAKKHSRYGFNFVPLVTQELNLLCGLEILFLRPDRPGSVVWAGDIDNRIKTLLDALRIPEAGENYLSRTPSADQIPFFCLLEDDKLITRVAVETDRLLEPIENRPSDTRLVITVRIRPYDFSIYNMNLA
jgi:hypothetical protein